MLKTAYMYRSIQLYHFVVLIFVFFLCDMLFTEINAAAAAAAAASELLSCAWSYQVNGTV